MKRLSNVFVFWLILVFGGLMVTVGYVLLQAPGTKVSFGPDVHLSEADKVYIAQITEQTKWLESLAYASLAGLIILQGKGSGDGLSKITSVGAGLLIVSLYGGFLSRDVILVALTKGTPLLYATLGTWPHVTQFWCLIVGLALLARDFLWTKKTAVAVAGATVLLFGFSSPSRLNAQPPEAHQPANPVPGCARDWAKSRFSNTASNEDSVIMSDFIARAAQRANIPSVTLQSCDFAYSTMDKVRYASKAINNGEDTLADTIVLTGSLRDQLKANAAAPGTFFATLINSLDVWHSSTGAISIETDRNAAVVMISGKSEGFAPLLYIAKPGTYDIRVIFGGSVLLQKSITVVANVRTVVTVP